MLEKLGGFQVRYYVLQPKYAKGPCKEAESLRAGFEYIKKHRPQSNMENEFVEFAEIHTNTDAPIKGWNPGLVKESLRNLAKSGSQARTLHFYPITLKDVSGWFLDSVLSKILPTMRHKGLLMLGKAGRGKSPVAIVLAFLYSAYYIKLNGVEDDRKPSCRSAVDMDFFREEPGTVFKPCIFDDGPLQKQSPEKLKAFLGVDTEDAKTRERWSCASFAINQIRIACANPYNPKVELKTDAVEVPDSNFRSLIAPAFSPDHDEEDITAVLKRASVVLLTDDWVYLRMPGAESTSVRRWKYPNDKKDLLVDACKPALGAYKSGGRKHTVEYEANFTWSLNYLHQLIDDSGSVPATTRFVGTSLFGDRVNEERKPPMAPGTPKRSTASSSTDLPGKRSWSFSMVPALEYLERAGPASIDARCFRSARRAPVGPLLIWAR